MIDDPNLHWRTYGALDFAALASHATHAGYHVAMATIPLDAWWVYPAAARLFREHPEHLSLAVHGNDHIKRELWRARSEPQALANLAQALQRVERLERRSGLAVSRVMVAPHEACSDQTLGLLMRLGYDAATLARPFPWIGIDDQQSRYARSPEDVMNGWFPADLRRDGFPILMRREFFELDEAVLRAYLDQPLIFFGHMGDLEALEPVAREINSLPAVRWCSLGEIAATNFATKRPGPRSLELRPFARRVRIDMPEDVEDIAVEWPRPGAGTVWVESSGGDRGGVAGGRATDPKLIRVPPGVSDLQLTLVPADAVAHTTVPLPPRALRPIARRFATEARDRALPLRSRLLR